MNRLYLHRYTCEDTTRKRSKTKKKDYTYIVRPNYRNHWEGNSKGNNSKRKFPTQLEIDGKDTWKNFHDSILVTGRGMDDSPPPPPQPSRSQKRCSVSSSASLPTKALSHSHTTQDSSFCSIQCQRKIEGGPFNQG